MEKIKPQIRQVNQNEVLLRDHTDWLYFSDPYQIVTAESLDDVLPALREVEGRCLRDRWHAAGYLSYEAASAFDAALRTRSELGFPFLWFGLYPQPRVVSLPEPATPISGLHWEPTTDCGTYDSAIARVKDAIACGRTYQVNYTIRLQTGFTVSAWEFFLHLALGQNRHAAYLDMERYAICSASPELFFELDGNTITCRPMKGTIARGRTTVEDREQSERLRSSLKDRAENVMIVDMIRNDLGRIADIGSVEVPKLFETERYPTLWQLTSTIRARTGASFAEIFTALFPCASITGAPKVSTMKLIAELEPLPRKIYTGTIGYLAPRRRARFNVAIRTALIDRVRQEAEYGIGGGIVWDSTSKGEYAEALLKARVLTAPQHRFSLLETLLWTPEAGYFLRQKHVARMLDSAEYFGIPTTEEDLEKFLEQVSSSFQTPQRVRLLLSRDGHFDCESIAVHGSEVEGTLIVGPARDPVDASDVFLFHKTTRRDVYEAARRGQEELDDVLLYNQAGELTEFTIGNLVAELDGRLLTPPVSCGVLAGTFRAHLLETGQIVERTIPLEQLAKCSRIFRVNSVRGWQAAEVKCQESQHSLCRGTGNLSRAFSESP